MSMLYRQEQFYWWRKPEYLQIYCNTLTNLIIMLHHRHLATGSNQTINL
jgi:hypothetical protein